jgi:hypothetical protein
MFLDLVDFPFVQYCFLKFSCGEFLPGTGNELSNVRIA